MYKRVINEKINIKDFFNVYPPLVKVYSEESNKFAATMKSSIKKVDRAVAAKDKEKAEGALKVAIKAIDKATSKGATKKNTAGRAKSRLTKKVNSME